MDIGEPISGETDLGFFDIETAYQDPMKGMGRPGSSGDQLFSPEAVLNLLDDPFADLCWDEPDEAPPAFCEPSSFGPAEA